VRTSGFPGFSSARQEKLASDSQAIRYDIDKRVRQALRAAVEELNSTQARRLMFSPGGGISGNPARVTLDSIPVSDENGQIALDYVNENFGNVGAIISSANGAYSVERSQIKAVGGVALEDDEVNDVVLIVSSKFNDPLFWLRGHA